MMIIGLGRGWIPNTRPFKHTFSAVHPLSIAAVPSDGSDLTPFTAPQMDQGDEPACVGHATSDAAFTSFAAAGKPLLWVPSQSWIYLISNAVTRAAQGLDPARHPLPNEGAMPVDAMTGLEQWGLRPMGQQRGGRFSDSDSVTDVAEPEQDEIEEAFEHSVASHAIHPGPNLVGDVCSALTQYAVPTGIFVDSAFENWNPLHGFVGAPINPNDPNGGGHYVDTVGFIRAGRLRHPADFPAKMKVTAAQATALLSAAARLPPSDPLFFGKNSWGTWGLNGYFLATKAWLTAPTTSDCNAILPVMKEVVA